VGLGGESNGDMAMERSKSCLRQAWSQAEQEVNELKSVAIEIHANQEQTSNNTISGF